MTDRPQAARRVCLQGSRAAKLRLLSVLAIAGLVAAGCLCWHLNPDTRHKSSDTPVRAVAPVDRQSISMPAALRAAYVRVRQADAGSAYDFVARGARSAEALLSNNPAMGLVAQAMLP